MFFKNKFKAPWDIPLPLRIRSLVENTEKRKVVYFYEKPDSSTFRYRVYNMCQALNFSDKWKGIYFFEDEIPFLMPYLSEISLMIFCRTRWSFTFDQWMEHAKKLNLPILFDIDDLVFNLDKIPLVMNTLNQSFREDLLSHWYSYSARLYQLGKKCHGTLGTNAYISSHLQEVFQKPSFIHPNFLNQEQITISEELYKTRTRGASFRLGYFSGSPSHANDFAKIAPEMADLLEEFPTMRLEVAGFMDFPAFLKPFVKRKQIIHTPFVDFITLQKKIAGVDINLIPLVDNEFTQCKSELKFFEAAIVGTVTLATPTYVYEQNIQQNKTGFLCEEGDWYPTIKKLYQEGTDPNLIAQANHYCLNKYSPQAQTSTIELLLEKAISLV